LIDHSDQVALALELLRSRRGVAAQVARRFRYVLVDELQDTNRAQLELVLALAGTSSNVMAVGDPDQGIYGFRGARTGNVEEFRKSFPSVATIRLVRNYRSLAPIVGASHRLLSVATSHPSERVGQVAHRRGRGTAIRHMSFATPQAEADGVAADIAQRVAGGKSAHSHCVLLRSNTETDEYVRALRVRGIDVDNGAPARLVDVPAVRALLAFLRVVADPSNSLEAFALASSRPYSLDAAVLTRLLNGARRRNRSFIDALSDAVDATDPCLPADTHKRARLFVGHVRAAVNMAATHSSGEVLYDYLRRSGLLVRLARATDEDGAAEARSVARFCELVRSRSSLLAHDRVCFLAPALELDRIEDDRDPDAAERDAVRVLTVHRAKGLEFDTVFICGLVDGRFPVRSRPAVLSLPDELVGDADEEDQALAEERRLFYVALTRARNEVVLTSHGSGPHGRGRRRPSIFIAETIDAPQAAAAPGMPVPAIDATALEQILVAPIAAPTAKPGRGPLTLSFSQIDEYLTCPERYRLRYDIGIPTPTHHALSYGTAIHQAIAAFHAAQSRGTILSEEELVAELRGAWQSDGFLSREHEDARFAAGAAALGVFRTQQIASAAGPPAAIEKRFTFRLGRDEIRGRIDKIDAAADGDVITDYKSSDVRDQKRADAKARDSLQLQVYALAREAETGELPKRLQLHFVESGIVGRTEPTVDRLEKARAKLASAADAIRAREFEAKPSTIVCGYCPFRAICKSSAA
jgi:DNA helicase II / ATP-dependent DNA helicase PcrA